MPRSAGAFPDRDNVVRYLDEYARTTDIPIEFGVRAEHLQLDQDEWLVETNRGPRRARNVVIATGPDSVPHIPEWPGRERFVGELIHSAQFGDLERYRGKSVLVVGAGNSGADVLNHLASIETGPVWVSVRYGPTVFPTWLWGVPGQRTSTLTEPLPVWMADGMLNLTERIAFGNLRRWGLRKHPDGGATRLLRDGVAPAIDNGFIAGLKAGRTTVAPEIKRFTDREVELSDGRKLQPDVVICATGYRTGLDTLVGYLGILDDLGNPQIHGNGQDPRYPGLWFIGMQPRLVGMFQAATRAVRPSGAGRFPSQLAATTRSR